MDKKEFFKITSIYLLLAVLFTPKNSNSWLYFFIPGIVLGILWFRKLE